MSCFLQLDDWVLCKIYKKTKKLKGSHQSHNNGVRIQEQSNCGSMATDVEPHVSENGDHLVENQTETLWSNHNCYSHNNGQLAFATVNTNGMGN